MAQQDGSKHIPTTSPEVGWQNAEFSEQREEDQKDIAAKMPGGKTNPVVPSTTSYRVRVRNTGIPAEGRLPTTRILSLVLVLVVPMEGISITSSKTQGGTTSAQVQGGSEEGGQGSGQEGGQGNGQQEGNGSNAKGNTNSGNLDEHVDTEIANADNNSNTNTEKPTTDTNRFSMGAWWIVCDS